MITVMVQRRIYSVFNEQGQGQNGHEDTGQDWFLTDRGREQRVLWKGLNDVLMAGLMYLSEWI